MRPRFISYITTFYYTEYAYVYVIFNVCALKYWAKLISLQEFILFIIFKNVLE